MSYRWGGPETEAVALEERVLADRERLLGSEHPDTLRALGSLADCYLYMSATLTRRSSRRT